MHPLDKSSKLSWGLKHEALNTKCKGVILPLMLYGAPVWIDAMENKCNKIIYNRVQRLINMKIAKDYKTNSYEALCILTGTIPIEINAEETATLIPITRDRQNHQLDHEAGPKVCTHPAGSVSASKTKKGMHYSDIQIWKQKRKRCRIRNRYRYVCDKGVSKSFETSFIDRQPMAVRE